MALTEAVAQAFAPHGPLARMQAGFRPRAGQTAMAAAVARTIEDGGALVVEAGTGVGKTFAYLVPALLSGERVLVSTATKALQDQLFARDLPRLVEALGLPVRRALLKGRASYLCLHRMELARQSSAVHTPHVARTLARVETWAQATRTGDLAELPELDERSPVIPLVTSTRENCLGTPCPRFRQCHVHLARREALAADVVVINHHLFFAYMAVRESGMAELLPTARVVIFDEAHQLNETGVQFLGTQLSTGQLADFARDLLAGGLQQARGLADWPRLAAAIDHAARDVRLAAGPAAGGARLRWAGGGAPEGLDPHAWQDGLQRTGMALRAALAGLDEVTELAPDLARLHERAVRLMERLAQFAQAPEAAAVRWIDVGLHLRLVESPLDIAPALRGLWQGPPHEPGAWDEAAPERPRAWVFTSATLGDDARLRWFTEPCGLEDAQVLRVESPFDYAAQAALHVPVQLPRPSDPAHTARLAAWVGDAVARLGGRTLVLTTTLRALDAMASVLRERFPEGSGIEVLAQGRAPKRRIMERFREAAAGGGAGCVLVASATFWEGFDVPGEALQLVVIDKLPFPPPGDPLVEARTHRLEQMGRGAFRDFALPEAAVALKQGAGRLIRGESDTGVLVVADTRLLTMGYGKRLLRALPPMRRLETQEAFDAALDALLTRTSTTDSPSP